MGQKSPFSKRHGLSRLAPDWREKIFDSVKSERLKAAVAVLSATGCRPSELERGVLVKIDGERLLLGIHGSKVDEDSGRGQPLRLISVSTDSPWGHWLVDRVRAAGGEMTIRYDAAGVSQRLREKSRDLWPRRKTLVSAYSYRHFIGKALKEGGVSAETIATALGHASDFSQTAYGRVGGGRKNADDHGIIDAAATHPIRHSKRLDKLSQLLDRTKKPIH